VFSPRLNIPPRPAVLRQAAVQPTVLFGQVSLPDKSAGARCRIKDKYPSLVPFWILGLAVDSNLNTVRSLFVVSVYYSTE
jgi:hypothetical protein